MGLLVPTVGFLMGCDLRQHGAEGMRQTPDHTDLSSRVGLFLGRGPYFHMCGPVVLTCLLKSGGRDDAES